ncbi:hypothetical protein ACB092_06G094800 [Castanea dentata]
MHHHRSSHTVHPSLKLTHYSSIADPRTITHLRSPACSSIILTDSSSSSPPTRFIIANPCTIADPLTESSIILTKALFNQPLPWAVGLCFPICGHFGAIDENSGVFCLQGYFKSCGFFCLWCFMYVFTAFK